MQNEQSSIKRNIEYKRREKQGIKKRTLMEGKVLKRCRWLVSFPLKKD
jgi:hypothetical protein